MWEELRLENAFLGVGRTSSTLSLTESSTTRGGRWGAIVKLGPHRGPGDTWLQTHKTVQMTGFGHQGLIPVALPLPCSSLFFPAGFSILSCIAFPRVLPSPFLANSPIFVSPPPLAAPYPDWLALFSLILAGFSPSYPFTSNLSLCPAQKTWCPSPQQSERLEIDAAPWLDDGGGPAALWGPEVRGFCWQMSKRLQS